jgi:hypothetical protein
VLATVSLVTAVCVALCRPADAAFVDFDNLDEGVQASDVLASSGVVLTTVSITDTVAVGDTIAVQNPDARFEVLDDPEIAVSPPNFAVPYGQGLNDVIMFFGSPVRNVSLRTDHYDNDGPDVVRLLALAPTNIGNQFKVLAIAEGLDDALEAPADTLSLNLDTPFQFAVFQITTELEGFDNLAFGSVGAAPATSNWGLALLAAVFLLWGMRRLRLSFRR